MPENYQKISLASNMKESMKNLRDLKSLFLTCTLLLSGCATTTKPVSVDTVTFLSYPSDDAATAIEVANDIASILPDLSKYRRFPQTTIDAIGVTHKTGIIATAIGEKIAIEYRTYYWSRSGSDVTEAVTSSLCELTVLPAKNAPGKFSVTSSSVSEKPGFLLLHIPLKPFVPSDQIAADIAHSLSLLGPKLEVLVTARNEKNAKLRLIENDRIAAEKFAQDQVLLQRKKMLENAVNFRTTMKVGVETNCGPIVDIKSDMIKVYFPVKNYGTEQWIRRDEIFPPSVPCRFVDGKYQFP